MGVCTGSEWEFVQAVQCVCAVCMSLYREYVQAVSGSSAVVIIILYLHNLPCRLCTLLSSECTRLCTSALPIVWDDACTV